MKTFLLNLAGKPVKAHALKDGNKVWLHVNGESWVVELQPARKKSSGGAEIKSDGDMLAPMPGKIIKVHVKVGDEVKAGQTLLAMEAMKMEYVIAAPFAGKILKMECREAQQVEHNQFLAKVEAT